MSAQSASRSVPKVLTRFEEIGENLRSRKNVNLLLDFDGTLAPIASTPDKARMPSETLRVLQKIREVPRVFVAIISGRSLENIMEAVQLDGIHYAGNHGLEISGVKKTDIVPNATQVVRSIRKMCSDIENILTTIPGAWVENKGLTASIHYRSVSMVHVPELNRIIGHITSPYVNKHIVRLTRGKKVIEIRPDIEWNKGNAVHWMLKNVAKKRAVTIYIGDNTTDEDAFRQLQGDITVKVTGESSSTTSAAYIASNTTEVRLFLQWLLERLTER
jgi:trehalose 6-phosphate phosphatase